MTHHRVELMQTSDDCFDLLNRFALCVSQFLDVLFLSRNELMKRRIQETDGNRVAFQSFIQLLEVSLLLRKDLSKCCFSLFYGFSADHLTECIDSVAFEEHMLCTAKTNTFCAKLTSFFSVCRSISVCTNFHGSVFICPAHDSSELASDGSVYGRDQSVIDASCRTIQRDAVSLVELFASQCEFLVCLVHYDITATGYTAGSHTTGNYGCVGSHTTTNSQDTLCRFHTCDIFWGCLKTNQNNFFSSFSPCNSVISCEDDFTASSSRRCSQCFCHWSSLFQCFCIELRMKQRVKVTRIDHCNCLFLCSHSLIYKVAGDFQSSFCCSLTVTCLQHVQFTVLYSELHISVVCFQSFANFFELFESFREFLFHLRNVHRCTNTGNYVLALCVGKELTEQSVLSCSRVTGEGNTCTTVISHVSECHHLYVNSGTPGIRDVVVTTINVCSRVVPGTEYGFYSLHQLYLRIGREILTDFSFVLSFELLSQFFEVICVKIYVLFYAFLLFHLVDQLFEVFFTNFHNYVREHLNESSVAVPSPTWVAGSL